MHQTVWQMWDSLMSLGWGPVTGNQLVAVIFFGVLAWEVLRWIADYEQWKQRREEERQREARNAAFWGIASRSRPTGLDKPAASGGRLPLQDRQQGRRTPTLSPQRFVSDGDAFSPAARPPANLDGTVGEGWQEEYSGLIWEKFVSGYRLQIVRYADGFTPTIDAIYASTVMVQKKTKYYDEVLTRYKPIVYPTFEAAEIVCMELLQQRLRNSENRIGGSNLLR
jgi:hypothetical protein